MASSNGYELPPYHDREYLAPSTSPGILSPLHSPCKQGTTHNILSINPSTATLLDNSASHDQHNVNSAPIQEKTAIQSNEYQSRQSTKLHLQDWCWEVTAAVFSLSCMVAVIVVLRTYEGKSLSSWHFHDITLNTLIALLSTLSRTTLIVPVASCIGQLKWIHFMSSPRPLKEFQILDDASRGPWGSLTVIWRLHFKTKLATWGAVITIVTLTMGPLSQQLLSYPLRPSLDTSSAIFHKCQIYDSGADKSKGNRGDTDLKMEGAVLNGIYDLSTPVQFQCKTGNCRWDDFTTLAVASECKNVTSSTNITCVHTGKFDELLSCNYRTPSGLLVESFESTGLDGPGYNSTVRQGMSSVSGGTLHVTLLEFATARTKGPDGGETPEITECSLRWVARRVQNTTVVNGVFHLGVTTDYELSVASPLLESASRIVFNVSNANAPIPLENRSFRVVESDHVNLENYLGRVFSSSSITDPFGLVLQNAVDMTKTMQQVSDSMSYALGRSSGSMELPGQTITDEQFIFVNWGWIALPITEVAMGIAFLIATVLQSYRKGVIAWKSSAIIPLLIEIEESLQTRERGDWTGRELEKGIKEMTGLLESTDDGGHVFRRRE